MSSLSSSLFPLPSLSLYLPYPRPLLSSSPRGSFSRFFSSLPVLFHRYPPPAALPCCIAHTRDTGVCEIPLSSCERPSAARLSRADREKSVHRVIVVVVVLIVLVVVIVVGGESHGEIRYRKSTITFYSSRSLAERKRRRQRVRKCALVSRFEGSLRRREGGLLSRLARPRPTFFHRRSRATACESSAIRFAADSRLYASSTIFPTSSSSSLSLLFFTSCCSNRAIFAARFLSRTVFIRCCSECVQR